MEATSETNVSVAMLDAVKLTLSTGDMLAVMVPQRLNAAQREYLMAMLEPALPKDVKVLIFDGGITVAAISSAKSCI